MSVTWSHFRSNNRALPLTLESIFRHYGAWAGIHDFHFDARLALASKVVTGTLADDWTISAAAANLPPNFTVRYHKTAHRQAMHIGASGSSIYYTIGTDADGYPFIIWAGTAVTFSVPVATPEEADVEIVFRQQILDDREDVVWRTISIYMNDALVTTYSTDAPIPVADNIQLSFCAYDADEVTYTSIVIPELCELAEFGTLDPGENAWGGLQRTLEGRYLKTFIRYDGSLRAWRKKTRDVVMTFDESNMTILRAYDPDELITHARMMGAYVWEEFFDPDLAQRYMHRFAEVDNAMLLTRKECREEAENSVRRSEEAAFTLTFEAQWVPVLEPEDRIIVDGESWIVSSIAITGEEGACRAIYRCRKYVW